MKSRIIFVFLVFSICWLALVGKSLVLQLVPNDRLDKLHKKQFEKIVTLKPRRGDIVDRNGKDLAVSVSSFSLYADPQMIESPSKVAGKLARILGVSYRNVYKKLIKKERRFTWIQRQLSKKSYKKIKSLKLRGVGFIEEPKRVYPNETLSAQVLGFVGRDGEGLEGLELKYEDVLSGKQKELQLQKDARGRPLLINGRLFTDYPMGSNLELTLDGHAQYFLENELQYAIDKFDADSAVGVVVDVETAEVLAMANVPTFNLNRPGRYGSKIKRNRVLTDAFEPGSTMKTFLISSAIREGVVKPNTRIFCENGKFKVGDKIIRESESKKNWGWLSVSEVLSNSSNIGSTKIAMKLGAKKLRESLFDFGFGTKVNLEFPGISKGIVHKTKWNPHLLANVSFGHGMTATPMQMAMAYHAIANGGVLYEPIVVKSLSNELKGSQENFSAKKIRRVLTKEQSEVMRLMLMSATSEKSTGNSARVSGYPVAGKTGTAQKVKANGRGYEKGAYISSFGGFVPANNPKFVIYIAVDNPRKSYYASTVAAPVFANMAKFLIRKSGLEPVLISQSDLIKGNGPQKNPGEAIRKPKKLISAFDPNANNTPDLIGLSLREVYNRLKGTNIQVNVAGSGLVSKSWPSPGEKLPRNKKVKILLKP